MEVDIGVHIHGDRMLGRVVAPFLVPVMVEVMVVAAPVVMFVTVVVVGREAVVREVVECS